MISNIVKKLVWRPMVPYLNGKLFPDKDYCRLSFAQEGEDLVLNSLFEAKAPIAEFYIDVGAYHPKRFSNTYYFYKRGWRGINIDAMPNIMDAFARDRPRDINVEAAIAPGQGQLTYHMYEEPGLNTFSIDLVQARQDDPRCLMTGKRDIKTRTLNEILEEHLPPGQRIGFMDVDVEGLDLDILKTLDFDKYAPQYLMIEDKSKISHDHLQGSEFSQFLGEKEYFLVGKTYRTAIFRTDVLSK